MTETYSFYMTKEEGRALSDQTQASSIDASVAEFFTPIAQRDTDDLQYGVFGRDDLDYLQLDIVKDPFILRGYRNLD